MRCKHCGAKLKISNERNGLTLYSFNCTGCGYRKTGEITKALIRTRAYWNFEYARADITWDKYIRDYLKE